MDPNRLHLNFGRGNGQPAAPTFDQDRSYQTGNERVYPTTPSTFPQPVFSPQLSQQDYQTSGGTSPLQPQSYFPNSAPQPYSAQQYGQQASYNAGQYQPAAGATQYSQRSYSTNDPNAGLARQLQNQHLSAGRQAPGYGRQTPPAAGAQARPRTGGANGQAQGGLLSVPGQPSSSNGQYSSAESLDPPAPDSSQYSDNLQKRMVGLHIVVEAFFKDNITRARERNIRWVMPL